MAKRITTAVVLAAGEGTRMRSNLPKVMHPVAGEAMIGHVLRAIPASARIVAVVGPDHQQVADEIRRRVPTATVFVQRERLGTAHAVLSAREAIADTGDNLLVVFGDTPLLTPKTLERLEAALIEGVAVAVLGFRPRDPHGYGRILAEGDRVHAIREEKDASAAERAITLCNAGVMALAGHSALAILERIGNANAKKEYYLTDAVEIATSMGLSCVVREADADEVMGINTKTQLAEAELAMQQRLRAAAMEAGVTLIAPETVFLSADTTFGRDVTLEPFVLIGPGVHIGDGTIIHAFSHLVGAVVGAGAQVGPYARLRPGTDLGDGAKIGNFVETKKAAIAAGAKVNHLTYIGDAIVGRGANIGAGTITCNYDGYGKHTTTIGAGAFIGSNSSLVAPVTIGARAYVGSGSVITRDVPEDSLAVERSPQTVREGWAARFRALRGRHKGK